MEVGWAICGSFSFFFLIFRDEVVEIGLLQTYSKLSLSFPRLFQGYSRVVASYKFFLR